MPFKFKGGVHPNYMCLFREFFGKGAFGGGLINTVNGVIGTGNGVQIFPAKYGALILTLPVGGFMCLGALIAVMQYALRRSAEKKEAQEKAEREAADAAEVKEAAE